MDRLTDLNQKIQLFTKEKNEILKDKEKEKLEEIKSLKWTKDHHAKLEISSIFSMGLPRYKILIYGNPPTLAYDDIITVFGGADNYQDNILYGGKDFLSSSPYFYTSNSDTLIDFLYETEFKSLDYDKESLHILQVCQKYHGDE